MRSQAGVEAVMVRKNRLQSLRHYHEINGPMTVIDLTSKAEIDDGSMKVLLRIPPSDLVNITVEVAHDNKGNAARHGAT